MALRGVDNLIQEAIGAAERVAHVKVGSLLQRLMYTYIREERVSVASAQALTDSRS